MSNEFDLELELAAIKDHSLEVEDTLADHDTVITIQAQKLMEVGFLEYETANYGTAYYKGNDIHYYVCEKEESMEKFMDMCLKENVHPAPVKYYYKRYDLLKDTDENVKRQFKYEVAEKRTLEATAVDTVLESEHDLILYTCTYSGTERTAVFFRRAGKE